MTNLRTTTAAALLLLAGSIVPAFAQGRGHDRGNNGSGRGRSEYRAQGQDRDAGREQYQQRDRGYDNRNRQQYQQPRYSQSYRQPQYQQQYNYRGGGGAWQQNSYRNQGYRGQTWSQRGGYRGYVIPRSRFYNSFGRSHFFRPGRPVFYNGYPRFQYGGYWIDVMDPIPAYWGDDWYGSNDMYVDYVDDGYYMYNRRYPGVGISINIGF
jgi:hypothetical protein